MIYYIILDGESEQELHLHLILVESLDDHMYNHAVNFKSAKYIWETIEVICKGLKRLEKIG